MVFLLDTFWMTLLPVSLYLFHFRPCEEPISQILFDVYALLGILSFIYYTIT